MIIFLHGPDTFRSRQKLQELKAKFIREIDKSGLNVAPLDGSRLEAQEFEKAISTSPFLAKKRLVIISDLIAKNQGQKIQKEILELLNKNNLENTIIIFWEGDLGGDSKKSRRSKTSTRRSHLLANRLKGEKYAQEFPLLTPAQTQAWASQAFKQRGGKISPNALTLLVDFVGNDLWQLNSEIDKLLAFKNNQLVEAPDIETMVKTKLDDDIFQLTDALGQKNSARALALISDQLQSGTSPTELLSKMVWQFKNLLILKTFVAKNGSGYNAERLTYQLKLHPFVIKKTLSQVDRHELTDLKTTYQRLLQIDYQLKTSQTDPQTLFDLLVIRS